jgi:hypothetical protein
MIHGGYALEMWNCKKTKLQVLTWCSEGPGSLSGF